MDYKDRIGRAETLGRKLLEYGEKTCSPDLCTCANVMLEDATAITALISRAEAAEARAYDLEKLLSAVNNMDNFHPDGTGFFVFTKKEADEITGKLLAAEDRAEKAEKALESILQEEEKVPFYPFGKAKEE